MRILFINSVCGIGSTGRIVTGLAEKYMSEGHICKIAYGRESAANKYSSISYKIGNDLQVKKNVLKSRILDNEAFNAKKETEIFIKWANNYNPDVVWLHNLHGYYINIVLLFEWIKTRPQMQVKWTLHDCWAFTGHCSHFSVVSCNKWKSQCNDCPQKNEYPKSWFKDNSEVNFQMKKKAFTGVKNMTIITPSKWLADLVKKSFLKEYPIDIVHNEIDKDIFKPTLSTFRDIYRLQHKRIVLGVASVWGNKKGLDDFIKLSAMLDDNYKIVLVGLNKKQINRLPNNILGILRTNSAKELAEIYTSANVFVNASKEETFGMTTVEALACGTDVIVYKDTACEEIAEEYGGIVVEQNVEELKNAVIKLLSENNENNRFLRLFTAG